MDITLVGLVVIALIFAGAFFGERVLLMLCISLLPFGMASIVNIKVSGNLSVPAAEAVAGILVLSVAHQLLLSRGVFSLKQVSTVRRDLIIFSVYSVFSGFVLVRIFSGDIDIFPLARDKEGERLDSFFRTFVVTLKPSSSNIAQVFYLLLSVASFFMFTKLLQRYKVTYFHKALIVCASLNIVVGVLDLLGMDSLLSFIRTANYALLTHHETANLPRVIGGFPEPSAFGMFTTTLFVYFSRHFALSTDKVSGFIALGSGFLALLSFSSTSYAGLVFGISMLYFLAFISFLCDRASSVEIYTLHAIPLLGLLFIALVLFATSNIDYAGIVDSVFTEKLISDSARERAAWAAYALNAFWDSYGMGVGPGSLRGNGWASVYLGSLGIPGTIIIVLFFWKTLFSPRTALVQNCQTRYVAQSAKLAASCLLLMMMITATTPNPGLLMMLLVAVVYKSSWSVAYRQALLARKRIHTNASDRNSKTLNGFNYQSFCGQSYRSRTTNGFIRKI